MNTHVTGWLRHSLSQQNSIEFNKVMGGNSYDQKISGGQ